MKARDMSPWKTCKCRANCSYTEDKFVLLLIRQYFPVRVRDLKVRLSFAFLPSSVFRKLDFVLSCPASKPASSLTPVMTYPQKKD